MPEAAIPALALACLAGLALSAAAALKGWRGWLDLKQMELASSPGSAPALSRTEMLQLRERVRRLEAIADGEV